MGSLIRLDEEEEELSVSSQQEKRLKTDLRAVVEDLNLKNKELEAKQKKIKVLFCTQTVGR